MTKAHTCTHRLLPQLTGFCTRAKAWAQWCLAQRPAARGRIFPVPLGTVVFTSPRWFEGQRVCLFSHFHALGRLLPSTLRYLRALHAAGLSVVCVSTSPFSTADAEALRAVCHTLLVRENAGLDFASWKCATSHFPSILQADALLLANDSVLLVGDMDHVFATMDALSCDFWGMTASQERCLHLQSYFLWLRKATLRNPAFLAFWNHLGLCTNKHLIIRRWETALTLRLLSAGLRGAAFIPSSWLPDAKNANPTLAYGAQLCHVYAMPLLKKAYLTTPACKENIRHWRLQRRAPLPSIDVLLPTYNGVLYLGEQVESIIAQQSVVPHIYARDDASTDDTVHLLHSFAAALQTSAAKNSHGLHPTMDISYGPHGGVVANVQHLFTQIQNTSSAYFALADQDDIWYPHKLSVQYAAMQALEVQHGHNTPLLVCADARGIDAQGEACFSSFFHQMRLPPHWGADLREVLVLSPTLGCSCMGNTALRLLATPFPPAEDIFMHDWWLLLVATCFGAVQYIHEPLLDYRQHERNVLGAPRHNTFAKRLKNARKSTVCTQHQAATFLQRYGAHLNAKQCEYITAWANMPHNFYLRRLYLCLRHGFTKPGLRFFIT